MYVKKSTQSGANEGLFAKIDLPANVCVCCCLRCDERCASLAHDLFDSHCISFVCIFMCVDLMCVRKW